MRITQADLVRGLEALGVEKGDVVFFHSPLEGVPDIEGGPDAVVDAFCEAVGPEGTVSVPTFVRVDDGFRDVFDIRNTPSESGVVTEVFRKRADALRSWNETHSIAAIGAKAGELAVHLVYVLAGLGNQHDLGVERQDPSCPHPDLVTERNTDRTGEMPGGVTLGRANVDDRRRPN